MTCWQVLLLLPCRRILPHDLLAGIAALVFPLNIIPDDLLASIAIPALEADITC